MTAPEPQQPGVFTVGKLILAGIVLTIAVLFGIKHFIGVEAGGGPEDYPQQNAPEIFKPAGGQTSVPGYNPARRAETVPGQGGSLEMFTKTNAGYAREEETESINTSTPARKTALSSASAAKRPSAAKPAAATTAIPKLRPTQGFGSSGSAAAGSKTGLPAGKDGTPDLSALMGGKSGTPDISAIMRNATKDTTQKTTDTRKNLKRVP